MKAKVHKRGGVQLVRVSLGMGEKVERRVLDRVRLSGETCFSSVTTELRMGEIRELNYAVTGLTSLKDVLADHPSSELYEAILCQVASAFAVCHDHGLNPSNLLLNTRFTFIDEDRLLRFAYLPLRRYEAKGQYGLKWFLEELTFAKVDVQGDYGKHLQSKVARYVRESGQRVSASGYCVFMASLGVALPKNVADYVHAADSSVEVQVRAKTARPDAGVQGQRYGHPNMRVDVGNSSGSVGAPPTSVWDRGSERSDAGSAGYGGGNSGVRTQAWGGRRPGYGSDASNREVDINAGKPENEQVVSHTEPRPWVTQTGDGRTRGDARDDARDRPSQHERAESVCNYALARLSTGKMYSLYEGRAVKIGRGSDCDIQLLGNDRMSRNHARLRCDIGGALITDLGSANGTYVDGRRLAKDETVSVGFGLRFIIAEEEFEVVAL